MVKNSFINQQPGIRLDQALVKWLPGVSRSFLKKLCETKKILVNNESARPSLKLKDSDKITILYDMEAMSKIPSIKIPILYEDEECVVIDKPTGLLTHSKGAFNPEPTVATWLASHLSGEWPAKNDDSPNARNGIVHRLDRATSGVMICAKTAGAQAWLQRQFSQRKVKKIYSAVVAGQLEPPTALIDMPIGRNPKKPQTFRVEPNGKASQTLYTTLHTNADHSLLELKPVTGRTHQLRVHLAYLKHPIVGDIFYSGEPAERLYLHALSLEITLPNRQHQVFTAHLPSEFNTKVKVVS